MEHCPDCGKEIEEAKPCPDCGKTDEGRAEASPPPGKGAAGPFAKRFRSDPTGVVRDAWENHRTRYAWTAMIWLYSAYALKSLAEQIIGMVKYAYPVIPSLLPIALHTILDPLTRIAAFVVGAYAIVVMARRDKGKDPVLFKDVLSGFGAATIPYAIAWTFAFPFYAAGTAFDGPLSQILWFYPSVVLTPVWVVATLLVFAVYRELSGRTGTRHLVFGVAALLALQELASWIVGFLLGIAIP